MALQFRARVLFPVDAKANAGKNPVRLPAKLHVDNRIVDAVSMKTGVDRSDSEGRWRQGSIMSLTKASDASRAEFAGVNVSTLFRPKNPSVFLANGSHVLAPTNAPSGLSTSL